MSNTIDKILQEIKTFEASLEKDLELYFGGKKNIEAKYSPLMTSIIINDYRGYETENHHDQPVIVDTRHVFSAESYGLTHNVYCFDPETQDIIESLESIGWDNIKTTHYGLDSILLEAELRDLLFTLEHIDWLKKEIGYTNKSELPF